MFLLLGFYCGFGIIMVFSYLSEDRTNKWYLKIWFVPFLFLFGPLFMLLSLLHNIINSLKGSA